jgi:EPS-associated MarR family transcriptional regulator
MNTQSPTLTDTSHLEVLRLLDESPSRSQREVAHALRMSLGKVNYVLKALLDKGLLKVQNFRNSQNKRGYAYLLTPEGVAAKAELTRHFLARKIEEYDALRLEIERLQAESAGCSLAGPVSSGLALKQEELSATV